MPSAIRFSDKAETSAEAKNPEPPAIAQSIKNARVLESRYVEDHHCYCVDIKGHGTLLGFKRLVPGIYSVITVVPINGDAPVCGSDVKYKILDAKK